MIKGFCMVIVIFRNKLKKVRSLGFLLAHTAFNSEAGASVF
jgi:hypothetical protein